MHPKILVAIVFCCFSYFLKAQASFNVAEHIRDNKTSNLVECQGNLYFTHYSKGDSPGDQLKFCSYDKNGVLRFKVGMAFDEVFDDRTKVIVTNDNKLVVVGWSSNCHVFSPVGYFYKFDTNGVVLASNTFQNNLGYDAKFFDVCQLVNSYYIVSPSSLIRLTSSGNVINYVSLPTNTIVSIDTTLLGKLVINTQNFESKIYDLSLNSLQSYTSTSIYYKYLVKNGFYYGLSNSGTIEKLNPTFQPTQTSFLSQQYSVGNRIKDFILLSDTIYAIGNNVSAGSFYLKLDTNLQAVLLLTNSTKNLTPAGISKINNYCYTLNNNIGNSTNPTNFYSLCGFKNDTIYNFSSSVALTGLVLDTYTIYPSTGFIGPQAGIDFRLKVTVMNTGTTVLNSFKLNTRLTDGLGNCNKVKYYEYFSGLNLSPNASITLTSSIITTLMNGAPNTSSLVSLYQCFYTTIPNNKNDYNVSDDAMCLSITGTNPFFVGISELYDQEIFLKIYPNPAENLLNISFDSNYEFNGIAIHNNLGQLVKKQTIQGVANENTIQIKIDDLPNGIYSLRLLNSARSKNNVNVCKRFVIAR